ncbi:DEAD/DEAH box helicase [Desulfurispora thermophila]|uniref:DEAD/DEAH box helicase n=1 Tax=Desulfurispora thermophila TaxID=265470 RepID=UPI00035DDAD7|nr:DEAD/DEAH box helicase [Desulfurispora thermophila]
MFNLRPYQQECLDVIMGWWQKGITRQLVSLPTGAGKTIIFASLARRLNTRTIILAHREELINQARDKLRLVWPEADVGIVAAELNEHDRQVVLASVQTASREKRLAQLAGTGFQLMIIDECHRAITGSYQRVIEALGFMNNEPERLLVGVTATAFRTDREALGKVFQEVVYERTIAQMVREGYLVPLKGIQVKTRLNLAGIHTVAGDYQESQLAAVVNTSEANRLIVEAYQQYAANRKAIAFTVNVQHAQTLAQTFLAAGIPTAPVYGAMPTNERWHTLKHFADGQLKVLTNCQLLTEGFDEPSVSALIMARPTKSKGLYIQMVGRGTRLFPGKQDCLVLELAGNDHDVCSLATLAGKQERNSGGGPAVDSQGTRRETDCPALPTTGELVTQEYDLLGSSRFAWVVLDGGLFKLPLDGGQAIWMRPVAGGYMVEFYSGREFAQRLNGQPLPLEYAQGIAEDWARANITLQFADKKSPWRKQPASYKQLTLLGRMGIRIWPGMTAGEASDLINREMARKEAWAISPATEKQIRALQRYGFHVGPGLTKGEAARLFKQARGS